MPFVRARHSLASTLGALGLLVGCGSSGGAPSEGFPDASPGRDATLHAHDAAITACTPGTHGACACEGEVEGEQVCNAEGVGYGACGCAASTSSLQSASSSDSAGSATSSRASSSASTSGLSKGSTSSSGCAAGRVTFDAGAAGKCTLPSRPDAGAPGALRWSHAYALGADSGTFTPLLAGLAADPNGGAVAASFAGGASTTSAGEDPWGLFDGGPPLGMAQVATYGASGAGGWAVEGSPLSPGPLTYDAQGDLYVSGTYANLMAPDSAVEPAGTYLARYSPTGSGAWHDLFATVGYAIVGPPIVAVDRSGAATLLVDLTRDGTTDFGCGAVTAGKAFAVVHYDAAGACVWANAYGSASVDGGVFFSPLFSPTLAIDASGNLLVAASSLQPFDLGAGYAVTAPGAFVAKLAPDGSTMWVENFAAPSDSTSWTALGADACGDVLVSVTYFGTLRVGGASFCATNPAFLLAKLSATGLPVWAESIELETSGNLDVYALAVDSYGSPVVTGDFWPAVDFGGGTVTAPVGAPDGGSPSAAFVASFAATGAYRWADVASAGTTSSSSQGVAVCASASEVVAGGWVAGGKLVLEGATFPSGARSQGSWLAAFAP